jgi:rare lipoprotein A
MGFIKQGCVVVLATAIACASVAQDADSVLDAPPVVELNEPGFEPSVAPAAEQTTELATEPPAESPVQLIDALPTDTAGPARTLLKNGLASWYGPGFHGRRTANGERYNMHDLTAAHRYLPFGTLVKVRSVHTGKSVVVRINDRGPYKHQRIIDLSRGAMDALGALGRGVTQVEVWVDEHQLADFRARTERFLNRSAVSPKKQRSGTVSKPPVNQRP